MISVRSYIGRGLSDLIANLSIVDTPTAAGELPSCQLSLIDAGAAAVALAEFHAARWPNGGPHTVADRMADLGELLAALHTVSHLPAPPETVFPRFLSASGRRTSEPGFDVVAFSLLPLVREPLQDSEYLRIVEAKHTTQSTASGILAALDADIAKTDAERVRDFLQLIASYLEDRGSHPYPERVNRFLDEGSEFVLSALVDGRRLDSASLCGQGVRRFDGRTTTAGIPVALFVVAAIADLETWISSTLP